MDINAINMAEERLSRLRERVARACDRSERPVEDVRIVAVSKTFGPDEVTALAEAGQTVFGESRVQEARQKIPLCPGHLEWHMVGHLQRNKVRHVVGWCSLLHSLDSPRLMEELEAACDNEGRTLPVLLEVNLAGEASKFGLRPDEVPGVLRAGAAFGHLELAGLMTLPPYRDDPEEVRPLFRRLRELRDRWSVESGLPLQELSMGMSHDFEVAIEEGATWIRPGTALFRERE